MGDVVDHKGRRKVIGRTRVALNPVGLAVDLSGMAWAEEWLLLRRQMGPRREQTAMPFSSARVRGGCSSSKLTTTVAITWVKELLSRAGSQGKELIP